MQYLALLLLISNSAFAEKSPTKVKVHFFEALAPKDSTSSERFQKEYLGAINSAKIVSAASLKKCGYELDTSTVFYNASDSLEALEKGKASVTEGAWMIVGPRRSNHYVLLVNGAETLPTVSTMASSQEVEAMGAMHLSMAPTNKLMAKAAASEAKKRASGKATFATVVSEDCLMCRDFAEAFDIESKNQNIKKIGEFKVSGETPDLSKITDDLQKLNPSFVLLPNYSKVTAQAIASIHKVLPKTFFVGGDGWGDSRFGFVQNAKDLEGTKGFTVRGFPSSDEGLKHFPLGKQILSSKDPSVATPGSAAALSLIKIIDGLSSLLCNEKPKDKIEFTKKFELSAKRFFKSPWGVSVYDLDNGDIKFTKSVKVK